MVNKTHPHTSARCIPPSVHKYSRRSRGTWKCINEGSEAAHYRAGTAHLKGGIFISHNKDMKQERGFIIFCIL